MALGEDQASLGRALGVGPVEKKRTIDCKTQNTVAHPRFESPVESG